MQDHLCEQSSTNYQLLLVIVSFAQATVYTKPQQIIHGWVEHLMLERFVCNTYCIELHRPEGDRFSIVYTVVPLLRDPPDERPPSFERPKVAFQEE